jgi:stress response protein YsnF
VVSKQAKVVEEVVVQKAATERTEKVKETVRHKDVDVKKAS